MEGSLMVGIMLAGAAALCLAIMTVSDKLTVKTLYQDNSLLMWLVSSVATCVFGLIGAGVLSQSVGVDLSIAREIDAELKTQMLIAGAIASLTLLLYLMCFEGGAESSVVASWFAAGPAYVYGLLWVLSEFGVTIIDVEFGPTALVAALMASVGLFMLEWFTDGERVINRRLFLYLVLMIVANTAYVVLIDQTVAGTSLTTEEAWIAFLPWFFLGFLLSLTALFFQRTWTGWYATRNDLLRVVWLLVILESVGMGVFYFEYLGLGSIDPTLVTIIVGSYLIVTLGLERLLSLYAWHLRREGRNSFTFMGLPVQGDNLVSPVESTVNVSMRFVAIMLVLGSMVLFLT